MDNIIAERVSRAKLTKSLRKIADYCIINPEEIGICSSSELARRIGVSDSSVTRFARAIGYSGYPEMKSDLYAHLTGTTVQNVTLLSMTERFNTNQARFRGQQGVDLFEKVTRRAIESTLRQNTQEQIDRITDGVISAEHRYVYGCRGTGSVAYQCAWLWRFLLEHVIEISSEGPGGVGLVQDIGPGDCMVMFSVTRVYKNDVDTARLVKSRGASLYLFTNSFTSPITEMADEAILVETQHMGFFNSMVPLHFLAEYITYSISQKREDEYRRNARERDDLTDNLRL